MGKILGASLSLLESTSNSVRGKVTGKLGRLVNRSLVRSKINGSGSLGYEASGEEKVLGLGVIIVSDRKEDSSKKISRPEVIG